MTASTAWRVDSAETVAPTVSKRSRTAPGNAAVSASVTWSSPACFHCTSGVRTAGENPVLRIGRADLYVRLDVRLLEDLPDLVGRHMLSAVRDHDVPDRAAGEVDPDVQPVDKERDQSGNDQQQRYGRRIYSGEKQGSAPRPPSMVASRPARESRGSLDSIQPGIGEAARANDQPQQRSSDQIGREEAEQDTQEPASKRSL